MSKSRKTYINKNQAGFTLVEMLISMMVFLIATGAIFGLLKIASVQKKTASTRTDQLKSARIALEYIRRDAINAGFGFHRDGGNSPDNTANRLFGLPADPDSERDWITSVIAGNNVTGNSLNTSTNMDFVAFVSREPSFNGNAPFDYSSASRVGSSNTVALSAANANNICNVNDLYLVQSGNTQVIAMATSVTTSTTTGPLINLAPTDVLGLNQSATGSGDNANLLLTSGSGGTIKKINIVSYGIDANGVLIRKTYGNQTGTSQIETRELVFGVSNFQIKYFMEDGRILDNPSSNHSGRTNQQAMNGVVQIQLTITIIPNEENLSGAPSAPVTIKEFISTRNLRYDNS